MSMAHLDLVDLVFLPIECVNNRNYKSSSLRLKDAIAKQYANSTGMVLLYWSSLTH